MNYSPETLKQLSNQDLVALSSRQYKNVSNEGLKILAGTSKPPETQTPFWETQKRELKGFAQGALNFGGDVGNFYIRTSNWLGDQFNKGIKGGKSIHLLPKNLPEFESFDHRIPKMQLLTPEESNTTEAKLGKVLGDIAPSFLLPEARVAQGLTKASKAVNWFENLVKRNLPRTIDAAINGGIQNMIFNGSNEKENLGKSFLKGGGIGAGVHALVGAPAGVAENFFKALASKARKNLSQYRTPEQVATLSQKLGQTPANLADVINIPPSDQTALNALKAMPFSGANNKMNALKTELDHHGHTLMQDLLGNSSPETIEDDIIEAIRFNRNKNYDETQKLFNKLNLNAELNQIKIEPKMLRTTANQLLKAEQKSLFPLLGRNLKNALQKIKRNTRYKPSFSELHFVNSDIYKISQELQRKGEQRDAANMMKLQDAIHQDMEHAFANSARPTLAEEWRAARNQFKQTVIPYRQRYLYDLLDNNKAPQVSLTNRLLTDRYNTVFNDLSPEMKSKLSYLYFNKAIRHTPDAGQRFDPTVIASLYEKMSPKIKNKLLSTAQQYKFDRLLALSSVLPKSFSQKNVMNMIRAGEAGGLGFLLGGKFLSPLGLSSILFGNRKLLSYLYSPKARSAYIKQQVGDPKLQAKIAKNITIPINYSVSESNDE